MKLVLHHGICIFYEQGEDAARRQGRRAKRGEGRQGRKAPGEETARGETSKEESIPPPTSC